MTSSNAFPVYMNRINCSLWNTGSSEITPISSFTTPYVPIPVQYPNNNGILYLNQYVPWSAHGMDTEKYFNENLEIYKKPTTLKNKSVVPASTRFQSTNSPDSFWYSNPYEAWNDNPIIVEPTEPVDISIHQ